MASASAKRSIGASRESFILTRRAKMAPSRDTLRGLRIQIRHTHTRLLAKESLLFSLPFSLSLPSFLNLSHARPSCIQFNRTDVPLPAKILYALLNSFESRGARISVASVFRARIYEPWLELYACINACTNQTRSKQGEKRRDKKKWKGKKRVWWRRERVS